MRRSFALLLAILSLLMTGLSVVAPASPASAAACESLPVERLALDAPTLSGDVGRDGTCWNLPMVAGEVLKVAAIYSDDRVQVVDADGQVLCVVAPDEAVLCTLAGPAPYSLAIGESGNFSRSYQIQVGRLTSPTGCTPAAASRFGATTPASVERGDRMFGCAALMLEAGRNVITSGRPSHTSWSLHAADGSVLCSGADTVVCEVQEAARFNLLLTNECCAGTTSLEAVVVPLAASTLGCGGPLDADWAAGAETVVSTSPLQVECRTFESAPGQRVLTDAGPWAYLTGMVVDESGDSACAEETGRDGCRLISRPPYRAVFVRDPADNSDQLTAKLAVRDLSGGRGCPVVAEASWGEAPSDLDSGVGCRILRPSQSGTYLVGTSEEHNDATVYDDGAPVCGPGLDTCHLEGGRDYVLVDSAFGSEFSTGFYDLAGGGCPEVAARPTSVVSGSLAQGQVDCVQLALDEGATVTAMRSEEAGHTRNPITYLDGAGATVCTQHGSITAKPCRLTGDAPFRAVTYGASGAYAFSFARLDSPEGCASFPSGAYGTDAGAALALPEGQFAACLTFPATEFETPAIVAYDRTSGTSKASVLVTDEHQGSPPCRMSWDERGTILCRPTSPVGSTVSVLLTTDGSAAAWKLVRRPTAGDASCPTVRSTEAGGPATIGALGSYLQLDCYTLPAKATDRFAVTLHAATEEASLEIYSPDGRLACADYGSRNCGLLGSTAYRVVVRGQGNEPSGGPYELSPTLVMSDSEIVDGCASFPDYTAGFGPLEATLSAEHATACVRVEDNGLSEFDVQLTNTEGGTVLPTPAVVRAALGGTDCTYRDPGRYSCGGFSSKVDGVPVRQGVLLVHRRDGAGRVPFSLTATCRWVCGSPRLTPTSPSTISGVARVGETLTVRSGDWSSPPTSYAYQWYVAGEPLTGATRSILTLGEEHLGKSIFVKVTAWRFNYEDGTSETVPVVVGEGPAPGVVTRPRLEGVARVDETVSVTDGDWTRQPTGYAYQWYAGGRPLPGETRAALRLRPEHSGKSVFAKVTASRSNYEDGTSETVPVVVGPGPAPGVVTRPRLEGVARVDETVSVTDGDWTRQPTGYAYQWYAGGRPLPGETGAALRLRPGHLGRSVFARVSTVLSGYAAGVSDTPAVRVGVGVAPRSVSGPRISGRHRVGSRVTATRGTWSKAPTSYSFRWFLAGKRLASGSRSLRLTRAMAGKSLRVTVVATRAGSSSGTATSKRFSVRR